MRVIRCAGRDFLTPEEAAAVGETARAAGVILFPTDTLYGLGVDPGSAPALDALFRLKGRDPGKPVPVLLADASLVGRYAAAVPPAWRALMERFWPGPLTLLFPAVPGLPPAIRSAADPALSRGSRPAAGDPLRIRQGRPPGPRQRPLSLGAARRRGVPHRHERQPRRGRRDKRPRDRLGPLRGRHRPVRERGNFAPFPGVYLA
jgi:hypothetical protein